jgi:hypothetical protein
MHVSSVHICVYIETYVTTDNILVSVFSESVALMEYSRCGSSVWQFMSVYSHMSSCIHVTNDETIMCNAVVQSSTTCQTQGTGPLLFLLLSFLKGDQAEHLGYWLCFSCLHVFNLVSMDVPRHRGIVKSRILWTEKSVLVSAFVPLWA